MSCFEGLVRSQRYQPNQQLEIYNFRVVPGLQISKEVDLFMIYMRTFLYEDKVAVQSQEFAILAEFGINPAPERCRCNEIGYPRGF